MEATKLVRPTVVAAAWRTVADCSWVDGVAVGAAVGQMADDDAVVLYRQSDWTRGRPTHQTNRSPLRMATNVRCARRAFRFWCSHRSHRSTSVGHLIGVWFLVYIFGVVIICAVWLDEFDWLFCLFDWLIGWWLEFCDWNDFYMQSISWLCMRVITQLSDPDLIYSIKPLINNTFLNNRTDTINMHKKIRFCFAMEINSMCKILIVCFLFFFRICYFENQFHYCSYSIFFFALCLEKIEFGVTSSAVTFHTFSIHVTDISVISIQLISISSNMQNCVLCAISFLFFGKYFFLRFFFVRKFNN